MQLTRFSRGQTLVELVVAMPIVLFVLFAIIYVSRLNVMNERAELALRYGALVAFNNTSNVYSAGNIYQNFSGALPACPTPPVAILSGGGPFPGPTSAPFWQPDSTQPGVCTAGASGFGGSQFIASHFWATTTVQVQAAVNVPQYLRSAIGATGNANTVETFIHAAYPGIILWCSKEVRQRVQGAITASDSSPILATPIPYGATPPPEPPNNNGACN
jgi:TadE-like protein